MKGVSLKSENIVNCAGRRVKKKLRRQHQFSNHHPTMKVARGPTHIEPKIQKLFKNLKCIWTTYYSLQQIFKNLLSCWSRYLFQMQKNEVIEHFFNFWSNVQQWTKVQCFAKSSPDIFGWHHIDLWWPKNETRCIKIHQTIFTLLDLV